MDIKTEKDLNDLINNRIEENTNLEYKDPDALKNKSEIAKDISAMSNSNGGIIIYGLCEGDKNHKPTKIKWIENNQEKERIEQILQANVTPKIDIKISSIPNIEDSSKFILVVHVPKSDVAPHMDHSDKDKRVFWRRNGYTTRQMEYYEVEDLFFKRKRPILEIKLEKNRTENPSYKIILTNHGKVIGEKIMVQLFIPGVFSISDTKWRKEKDLFFHGAQFTEYIYFENNLPVFPGVPFNAGILYHPNNVNLKKLSISFLITCADMELKKGKVTIEDDRLNTEYNGQEVPPPDVWVIEK